MVTTTRRPGHRAKNALTRTTGALVACAFAVGLGAVAPVAAGEAEAPESAVTISELKDWALNGTDPKVMRGKIEESGTVYRMTPDATSSMREVGVPSAIISYMDLLYTNAVKNNPSLATSDEHWTKVGNYYYGGKPFGWPDSWTDDNAPAAGSGIQKGIEELKQKAAGADAAK